ncbi:hypothetical protein CSPAE12_01947 [Colletotrichum incanum]|nr:hypothetical protein CSPAE12_01947 [Colletotrichum incanum]
MLQPSNSFKPKLNEP